MILSVKTCEKALFIQVLSKDFKISSLFHHTYTIKCTPLSMYSRFLLNSLSVFNFTLHLKKGYGATLR
ncbi:MAG: hypothetical protein JNL70_03580 [Saprospiraceae bacterium]|nr:hypothetical protein [Saprospiraceae bacterium]